MDLWYLSFATDERGFLGATVVEGASEEDAFQKATERGLNPGGEVAIWGPIPTDAEEAKRMLNRLCGEEEMRANGGKKIKELDDDMADLAESNATFVCASCNEP